jgi:hypothetical protein
MVDIGPHWVRKVGPPAVLAAEVARSTLAAQLGDASGAFYVPRILRFDPEAGVAEFERLHGLRTLAELAYHDYPSVENLFFRAGRALGVIHNRFVMPADMRLPLPAEWMVNGVQHVFLHGDYTTVNVCLHEPTGQLVILDWSSAPFLNSQATFGPAYFDLVSFVFSLFTYTAFMGRKRLPLVAIADGFVSGYATERGRAFERAEYGRCRKLVWRLYWQGRTLQIRSRPWYLQHILLLREWCWVRKAMAYEPLLTKWKEPDNCGSQF